MSVLIGVPNTGSFPWQFVGSALSLQKPENTEWQFIARALVYVAREQIAQYAIDKNFDYVFFLDSDMVIAPDTLLKLFEHDKDIVSGIAFKRSPPYQPCFYEKCNLNNNVPQLEFFTDWESDAILEAEGVGMACVLIKTDVFKNISKPWFAPEFNIGEDLSFCLKAREAGYKIHVDTSINAGHVGNYVITEQTYKNYHKNAEPSMPVNSHEWWENEFKDNWVNKGINGIEQTRYFMKLLIKNLQKLEVGLNGTILDYGCALGQGVDELLKAFPTCHVEGYDYAQTAIKQACELFPHYSFWGKLPNGFYDTVISSNVLEHYVDPITEIREQMRLAKKYYIAMTPYNQTPNSLHPATITEKTFPVEIDDFKLKNKILISPDIDISSDAFNLCPTDQILVVYEK